MGGKRNKTKPYNDNFKSVEILLHSSHHQLSGSFYDDFEKKGIEKLKLNANADR